MDKVSYDIDTSLLKDMSVCQVANMANRILAAGGADKAGIDKELGIAALYMWNNLKKYRFSQQGFGYSLEYFFRIKRIADDDFIQIHRLNHMTFFYAQEVADYLDDKKLLTSTAKRYWKKFGDVFEKYQAGHRKRIDHASWTTVQDYTRMVYNVVHPYIEPLEACVRDYLIQRRNQILDSGQKDDITLLTKIYVALMFFAGTRNTRHNFFVHQLEYHGFDLSADFKWADVDSMCNHFVGMMEAHGVKFTVDKDGDKVPVGVDMSQSVRVNSAWNDIVSILTDEELMDRKAIEAIEQNPKVKEDYERILAEQEQATMQDALEELKKLPNVKSL